MAPLLKHVVFDLRLESVRSFNPVNEPMEYGVYRTPEGGPDVYRHYVGMYREMRAALDRAGVPRERVGLVGGDTYTHRFLFLPELAARGIDLDPFVDLYSIHFYSLRFDTLPERGFLDAADEAISWRTPPGRSATVASGGSGSSPPRWELSTSAGG